MKFNWAGLLPRISAFFLLGAMMEFAHKGQLGPFTIIVPSILIAVAWELAEGSAREDRES